MATSDGAAAPAALVEVLTRFEKRLREVVIGLPLHLMSEQEMRRTLAEVLLGIDRSFYSQVGNLQYEKSGSGIPTRQPVDLFFQLEGKPVFIEFKYWHTMLKVRSRQVEIGKGNATPEDYSKLKHDFVKLARIENTAAVRLLICMAQVQQYPHSASQLMVEYADQCDPENARALFYSSPGARLSVHHGGLVIQFEMERDAFEVASPEGIAFRLFTYRVVGEPVGANI